MISALLLPLLITKAFALTFENNAAAVREPYAMATLTGSGVAVDDPGDDIVVFDRARISSLPPLTADLTSFSVLPTGSGYTAVFQTKSPLPADPGMPVNFFVHLDADGDPSNNAAADGSGPGSDATVMLLFGTKTKWHSEWWQYDALQMRWNRQAEEPSFTATGSTFTLALPSQLILVPGKTTVRGFALTAVDRGPTAEDVAPGVGLPPLAPVSPKGTTASEFMPWLIGTAAFMVICFIAIGGILLKKRQSKLKGFTESVDERRRRVFPQEKAGTLLWNHSIEEAVGENSRTR